MILSVDPSISNFGWALGKEGEILDSGHKRTYSKYPLVERVLTIREFMVDLSEEHNLTTLVCEGVDKPRYHMTHGVSTFWKLGLSVGVFFSFQEWDDAYLLTPDEWKGKTSKSETLLLAKSLVDWEIKDGNEADAIGLLNYFQLECET